MASNLGGEVSVQLQDQRALICRRGDLRVTRESEVLEVTEIILTFALKSGSVRDVIAE